MPCQNNIFLLNWYHHLVADLETFVSMLPPLESSEIIFFWQWMTNTSGTNMAFLLSCYLVTAVTDKAHLLSWIVHMTVINSTFRKYMAKFLKSPDCSGNKWLKQNLLSYSSYIVKVSHLMWNYNDVRTASMVK